MTETAAPEQKVSLSIEEFVDRAIAAETKAINARFDAMDKAIVLLHDRTRIYISTVGLTLLLVQIGIAVWKH